MNICVERSTCRVCSSEDMEQCLSLGSLPLANRLVDPAKAPEHDDTYPLALNFCSRCGMVQTTHTIDPSELYYEYPFRTSSSTYMLRHFWHQVCEACARFTNSDSFVVEIGSNDGSTLQPLRHQIKVLGVDPSRNLAVIAEKSGVPTIIEPFTSKLAKRIRETHGTADLIIANNVLGHVDDLHDVLYGVALLLSSSGGFVFEVPYLDDLVNGARYDTIYHEHVSYFSLRPLVQAISMHGLTVDSFKRVPVHGGSIRITARPGITDMSRPSDWFSCTAFQAMQQRVDQLRESLRHCVVSHRVIGYTAPAKATIVLNYCGLGTDQVPMLMDITPEKHGRLIPGTRQSIVAPEEKRLDDFDAVLLFAWNHHKEIMNGDLMRGRRLFTPYSFE